jgi:hypothetical protein
MILAALVVLVGAALCGVGGWLYFARYDMPRPPIGVSNLGDVAFAFVAIILVPILYVVLPLWLVTALFILASSSIVYFLFEPMLPRPLVWVITIMLVGADLAAGYVLGVNHPLYLAINNIVIVLTVVSIANAWASSGMYARDAAVLGVALIFYDFIATAQLSLMGDLFTRLSTLPLAPILAWGNGETYAAIGLGDLMMLAVFPLTMWKGFGKRAGLIALGVGFTAIVLLFVLPIGGIFPVMVVLGPLILIQYLWWRRHGQERRFKEFRPSISRS